MSGVSRAELYRQRNRDQLAIKQREYYKKNKETILARLKALPKDARDKNLDRQLRSAIKRTAEIKALIFDKYGNKCASCGFDDDCRAFQMDHVNGGGSQDVLKFKSKWKYWRHVLEDETGKFQILCANCNAIKRIENGEHRKRSTYKRTYIEENVSLG
jgi:hypothetical protein